MLLRVALWLCLSGCAWSADWPQIKITTTNVGLHRVSASALASVTGLAPNEVRDRILQGSLTLVHRSGASRWFAEDGGAGVFFHAELLRNHYTDRNVYWLLDGTNSAGHLDGGAPSGGAGSWYLASTNLEQDVFARYELGVHPDSNYWYWVNLVGSHPLRGSQTVVVPLDSLATGATARVTVRVFGATTTNHVVNLAVNGITNSAWQGTWTGKTAASFSFDIPPGLLLSGSNSIKLSALGAGLSQWWLDGFRLEYPRLHVLQNGALHCIAGSNSVFAINGFASSNFIVLDVSDPNSPLLVTNLHVEPVNGNWRVCLSPPSPGARFSIAQNGNALPPAALELVTPQNLRSSTNRAACVVIAPGTLQSAASQFVSYRNSHGLETRLVSLESVYNEFNGGVREPESIRTFLRYARTNWALKPSFALLAGNGTYDYRNLLAKGDNLLPPLMTTTLFGLAVSDSEYGNLGVAGGHEVAVGRLPATNASQLDAMISKIASYEAQAPATTNTALLIADFPDPLAGDFPTEMLEVQSLLAPAFTTAMVPPSTTVQMHTQVLSNINRGTDLVCYLGHGSSSQFGALAPGYLASADINSLTNGMRLPVVVGITCLAGGFGEPASDCLAEACVLAGAKGAIAAVSASGFSLDPEATELNLELMSAIVHGPPARLGQYLRVAMDAYDQNPHFTPASMFNLIGDPTLVFRPTPLAPSPPPVVSVVPSETTVPCDAIPEAETTLPAMDYCTGTLLAATANADQIIPGSCPGNYVIQRTWTATDACGISATVTQFLHVVDIKAPVITGVPSAVTVESNILPPGPATLPASDNCDAAVSVATLNPDQFLPGPCACCYTILRTWTAGDACGNSATATQAIQVVGHSPPIVRSVMLGSDGSATLAFEAIPGRGYQLLACTNLVVPAAAWSVVETGVVPPGPFLLIDREAAKHPQRFYRLVTALP